MDIVGVPWEDTILRGLGEAKTYAVLLYAARCPEVLWMKLSIQVYDQCLEKSVSILPSSE